MAKMLTSTPPPRPARRTVGLGDVIEVIARPVAKLLGIKDCQKCKDRQERANAVQIPIGRRRP